MFMIFFSAASTGDGGGPPRRPRFHVGPAEGKSADWTKGAPTQTPSNFCTGDWQYFILLFEVGLWNHNSRKPGYHPDKFRSSREVMPRVSACASMSTPCGFCVMLTRASAVSSYVYLVCRTRGKKSVSCNPLYASRCGGSISLLGDCARVRESMLKKPFILTNRSAREERRTRCDA